MVKYKLWLDDIRFPPNDDMSWRIARSYNDAVWYVRHYGLPSLMSLDHDLGPAQYASGIPIIGENKHSESGMDFVRWFCNYIIDQHIEKPRKNKIFQYYVHSENPVGKINMLSYLNNFIEKEWK